MNNGRQTVNERTWYPREQCLPTSWTGVLNLTLVILQLAIMHVCKRELIQHILFPLALIYSPPSLFLPYPSSSSSREGQSRAKVLSNMVKQKRKEKAVGDLIFDLFDQVSTSVSVQIFMQGKWTVPLPKVRVVGEDEVFKVLRTGKRKSKFSIFTHNDMYFNFTFVFNYQRRVGSEWSPRLHMWVRASQENHPNTRGSSDQWYVYILPK